MKRILHILAQIPGRTGSGTFLQALIREGFKKGYAQALIAGVPQDYEHEAFLADCPVDFYAVSFETREMPFPVVGMSDTMPYHSTRYQDMTDDMLIQWKAGFARKIREAVEGFKPDYIICHHLWLLTALVTELVKDVPIVAISHGTDLRQLQQASRFADEVIKGCSKVKLVFALNEHQSENITLHYGFEENKIKVIGGGFHADVFYAGEGKKSRTSIRFVYAGKLSFSKGVLSLIRAFEDMDGEDCELYLVGSGAGDEEKTIKELAQSASRKIFFTGAVPQEKLADIFRESDLFILPSFYEGLPLVLIEALATGLRAVSSELPGLTEWLGKDICESGAIAFAALPTLISVDRPIESELPAYEERVREAMTLQMNRILANEPLDHQLIRKNIMRVSWESIFRKIDDCLQS